MKDISAFPKQPIIKMPQGCEMVTEQGGMTLRDYFAAKAMQGMGSDPLYKPSSLEEVAILSYQIADAMIKTRSL